MSESLLVEKIVEALTHVETPAESLSLFTDNPNMRTPVFYIVANPLTC